MADDELWIDVTDADVRSARDEYRAARDRRGPDEAPERVAALRDRLELLWRIQARQIVRDFHGARRSA
jgi:hypothetical protein